MYICIVKGFPPIKLINTFITSHIYLFFLVRIFTFYFLNNFQLYNTVGSTTVTMLHLRSYSYMRLLLIQLLLNPLSTNSSIWVVLGSVSTNCFPWLSVSFFFFFACPVMFQFSVDIRNDKLLQIWIMLFASKECWHFFRWAVASRYFWFCQVWFHFLLRLVFLFCSQFCGVLMFLTPIAWISCILSECLRYSCLLTGTLAPLRSVWCVISLPSSHPHSRWCLLWGSSHSLVLHTQCLSQPRLYGEFHAEFRSFLSS